MRFISLLFKNILKKTKKAAVIIEFAIAVPLLVSLVYFAYDVPKLKRFEAQLKADISYVEQMINAIRYRKAVDKKITKADIVKIVSAIGIPHNMTALQALPYRINVALTLIEGVGFDKFSVCWNGYSIFAFNQCTGFENSNACTQFKFEKNTIYETSQIDNSIHIRNGEYKMIIEIGLNNYIEEDSEQVIPKFGFAFIEPKNAESLYEMKLRQYSVITVNKANFSDEFPQ